MEKPLSHMDALFAAYDRDSTTATSHFCLAVRFDGAPPSKAELVAILERRWLDIPILRQTLVRHHFRWPSWHRPTAPALSEQVDQQVVADLDGSMREAICGLLDTPLPSGRPPWRLCLLRVEHGRQFALVLLTHHALLDGLSARTLMARLLSPGRDVRHPDTSARRSPRPPGVVATAIHSLRLIATPAAVMPWPMDPPSARHLAMATIELPELSAGRDAYADATVNDVYLAAVTAALRAELQDERTAVPDRVFATIPVSLRSTQDEQSLGNLLCGMQISLPVIARTSVDRLRAVVRRTRRGKDRCHAAAVWRVLGWFARLGWIPLRAISRLTASRRRSLLMCSNIRALPPALGLGEASAIDAFATTLHTHGIAIMLSGYGERLNVTVVADRALAGLADRLAGGIAHEIQALERLGRRDRLLTQGPKPTG